MKKRKKIVKKTTRTKKTTKRKAEKKSISKVRSTKKPSYKKKKVLTKKQKANLARSRAMRRYWKNLSPRKRRARIKKSVEAKRLKRVRQSVVLIQPEAGQEIPAFQVKDQVEADSVESGQLDEGLATLEPGQNVDATFSIVKMDVATGEKIGEKQVNLPIQVTNPTDREQFWRDFYASVREDLEDELYDDNDNYIEGVSVTLAGVHG